MLVGLDPAPVLDTASDPAAEDKSVLDSGGRAALGLGLPAPAAAHTVGSFKCRKIEEFEKGSNHIFCRKILYGNFPLEPWHFLYPMN